MENNNNTKSDSNNNGVNLSNMFDLSKIGKLLGMGGSSNNRGSNGNPLNSIFKMFKGGFGNNNNQRQRYRNSVKILPIEEAYRKIKAGKIFLLDVRTEMEYKCIRIKGSINVPLDKLQAEIDRYAVNKSEEILIYCATGARVRRALQILWGLGYTNLFIWEGAGINTFAFQDLIVYNNGTIEENIQNNLGGINCNDRS